MSIAEIKAEISHMTLDEKAEIVRAIGWEYDAWDLQMIEDGKPGGRLALLREEALTELRDGTAERWP
ncbi:MAG: hypothetical protein LBK71_08235 [Verrucomicrobiales bacterium]|jgi:hypothetical protein|nr:hypothetical protein [Verrucomicrobiales bacterium]